MTAKEVASSLKFCLWFMKGPDQRSTSTASAEVTKRIAEGMPMLGIGSTVKAALKLTVNLYFLYSQKW
jgi:hypothetical protein